MAQQGVPDKYPAMQGLRPKANKLLIRFHEFENNLGGLQDGQQAVIRDSRTLLDQVVAWAQAIVAAPDTPLQEDLCTQYEATLDQMYGPLSNIAGIKSTTDINEVSDRMKFGGDTKLLERYFTHFQSFFTHHLASEAQRTSAENIEGLRERLESAIASADEMRGEIERELDGARKAAKEIRGLASGGAVSAHAQAYGRAYRAHNWIFVFALAALLNITFFLVKFLSDGAAAGLDKDAIDTWPAFAIAVYPNLPYGILYVFGLAFLIKVAVSERHNAVVASQKRTALETFETFFAAAGNDEIGQAVLLSTTAFIFASQGTAYTKTPVEVGGFRGWGTKLGPGE